MQEEHWKLLAGLQKTGCQRGKRKLSSSKCWNFSVYIHLNSCQHNLSGILLAVFRLIKINFEFNCVVASSLSFSFPPTLREHKNLFYLVPGYILAYLWSFEFIPYLISVQVEFFLLSDPTFLGAFDLKFHMPGHFFLFEVVYGYPSGPLARLHKNRTKRL